MKLVVAIVQDQDAGKVVDSLITSEFRVTRINAAGGFLRKGNAILMVGVEDEKVDEVIETIDQNSQTRPVGEGGVTVGAGTVFVLKVGEFVRV
jgi:uncharacterized protein YaaQ